MAEALTAVDLFQLGLVLLSGFALGALAAIWDCNRRGH